MKFDFLKDRSGDRIGLKAFEEGVFDKKGRNLIDKIKSINTKISYIQESIKAIDARITKLKGPINNDYEEALKKVILREDENSNICLLKDDNGKVTSEYGYDYKLLSGILYTGKYEEYIKDGDWIELNTADGGTYKLYANIDTYYGEGEEGNKIGHHIDFISDNLIYGSVGSNGEYNYSETNINSWRMNNVGDYGNNNGVANETSPFLANSTEHRGSEGGIIDKLNAYYNDYIPGGLKSYIIKKYHKVPTRYQEGSDLTLDNGVKWAELPYLWIPYYKEVWGDTSNNEMSTTNHEAYMKEYHSFSSKGDEFKVKFDTKYSTSSAAYWWTASAISGYLNTFCCLKSDGSAASNVSNFYRNGAPLCFRFKGREYTNNPLIRDDLDANICLLTDVNGVVSSAYNYDYEFISDGLYQGDFDAYVRDGDWIELTTADGYTHKMYANVDTYYGEGPEGDKIGHHIDFISRQLIPGSYDWQMRTASTNNGVEGEQSPFLSSTTKYRSDGEMIDRLNMYYNDNIPSSIKSYIINKYHNVPLRYSSTSTELKLDTGSTWKDMGYLWLPYATEVKGSDIDTTVVDTTYEGWMKQYHSFLPERSINTKKYDTTFIDPDTGSYQTHDIMWWTATPSKRAVGAFDAVTMWYGIQDVFPNQLTSHPTVKVGVPLCFRFTARPASKDPIVRDTHAGNICLLKDDNGVITSDFNYDYEFLADTLDSGNYSDYIKDGDYIELTTNDGATYKMYANVDTYYGYGDGTRTIGHHIDFISDNLIYGSRLRKTDSSTSKESWRMNGESTYGVNNGVASETSPFLANSTVHRGSEGGIIDKLDAYFNDNIPSTLKPFIARKYLNVPTRYSSAELIKDDNGSKWAELPYLWIPYEKEVHGSNVYATSTYETNMKQYHSFNNITNFRIKCDMSIPKTAYTYWWTASSHSTATHSYVSVMEQGQVAPNNGNNHGIGAPLCFRFMKKEYDPYEGVKYTGTTNVCLLTDNNGTVTSDYGFTYEKLAEILNTGKYDGYIKDGDWIAVHTPDGIMHTLYASVDTYYGYGDGTRTIGHHIDFISRHLIPGSRSWKYRTVDTNNGPYAEKSPFLASTTKYRADGSIIDILDTYYEENIPSTLKEYIVPKFHNVPYRYNGTDTSKEDTGSEWREMSKLWLPYEKEIIGACASPYEEWMNKYNIFNVNSDFIYKQDRTYSTTTNLPWWTASAVTGLATAFVAVNIDGKTTGVLSSNNTKGYPLCFRFASPEGGDTRDVRDDLNSNVCLLKDNGNGVIQSDYNYTYEFLVDTLDSGDYSNYIKNGDWIELTTKDGYTQKLIANVDTYYGYRDTTNNKIIGHHIDFISEDLIPGSSQWQMRSTNSTNGVAEEQSPFLASSTKYISTGLMVDKLESYYNDNIPSLIKNYIVKKYHNIPYRYSATETPTTDTGSAWRELPYLWIPYEKEFRGFTGWGVKASEEHMQQYTSEIPANGTICSYKRDLMYSDTSMCKFWMATAIRNDVSGNTGLASTHFAMVRPTNFGAGPASEKAGAPLCFRFTKNQFQDDVKRKRSGANGCILRDSGNGVYQSDYNYTYDFISEVLESGDYSEYIHNGDWIELTTSDGYTHHLFANIDTYYGEGDGTTTIGHHIDFISRHLIPGSKGWTMRSANTNNGNSAMGSPFLSSTKTYRTDGVIVDKLDEYYNNYIKTNVELDKYIVNKYHYTPWRHQGTKEGILTTDNGNRWTNLPKLWLPYEKEVLEDTRFATGVHEAHMKRYSIFNNHQLFAMKCDNKYSTSEKIAWWLASAYNGDYISFCCIYPNGQPNVHGASYTDVALGAPLCFRFQ